MPVDPIEPILSWLYLHDRGLDGAQVTLSFDDGAQRVALIATSEMLARFADVLRLVQAGLGVIVLPAERDLTTTQAGTVLGVSRAKILDLVERGDLACYRAGTHRRIRLVDVLDYRRRQERHGDEAVAAARLAMHRALHPAPGP